MDSDIDKHQCKLTNDAPDFFLEQMCQEVLTCSWEPVREPPHLYFFLCLAVIKQNIAIKIKII